MEDTLDQNGQFYGSDSGESLNYSDEFGMADFGVKEETLKRQSGNAIKTLLFGLGSLLCLLLVLIPTAFLELENGIAAAIIIIISHLIGSVLIFFLAGKKIERWYYTCFFLNYTGIGLAVWLIMSLLELDIGVFNIVLGMLPAAAILAVTIVFYNSTGRDSRKRFLYGGTVILVLAFIASVVMIFREATDFWVCTAVSTLICAASLGALIWANSDRELRSILKGQAVASFFIYVLIVVIAIALLILSSSDSDHDSDSRSSSSGSSGSAKKIDSRSRSVSGSNTSGRGRGILFRYSVDPSFMWHYTVSSSLSHSERMRGMPEEEKNRYIRRYRLRRALILIAVTVGAAAVIAAAVIIAQR